MRFIDFCAGIGGGRLGLERLGMQCLGFLETDKQAVKTYRHFFGNDEVNYGDVMQVNPLDLPDFDLMLAGFPCQAFSILGQRQGLMDQRGQVIFGLLQIMKAKQVKYFILENVKGLVHHQQGQTLKVLLKLLRSAGYKVIAKIMDSCDYGIPHKRERIYFIGVRDDLGDFEDFYYYFAQHPKKKAMKPLRKYLIDEDHGAFAGDTDSTYQTFLRYLNNKYNGGRICVDELLEQELLIIDTRQSDLRLYRDWMPTLRMGRHGILYVKGGIFRRLSAYEALLLQGFPKKLALSVKGLGLENQILSQAGNAMTVNVVEACGRALLDFVNKHLFTKPLNIAI